MHWIIKWAQKYKGSLERELIKYTRCLIDWKGCAHKTRQDMVWVISLHIWATRKIRLTSLTSKYIFVKLFLFSLLKIEFLITFKNWKQQFHYSLRVFNSYFFSSQATRTFFSLLFSIFNLVSLGQQTEAIPIHQQSVSFHS